MSTRPVKKSRQPIRKKSASPSLTSLFSSVTKISNGSSGSSSTVTPISVVRRRRSSSNHGSRTKSVVSKVQKPPTPTATPHPTPPDSPMDGRPNVFAFMEEFDEEENAHQSGIEELEPEHLKEHSDEHSEGDSEEDGEDDEDAKDDPRAIEIPQSQYQTVSPPATPETYKKQPTNTKTRRVSSSFHSDSGISMASDSPEQGSPIFRSKIEMHREYTSNPRQPANETSNSYESFQNRPQKLRQPEDLDSSPEAFYIKPRRSQNRNNQSSRRPAPFPLLQTMVPFQQQQITSGPHPRHNAPDYTSATRHISVTDTEETSVFPVFRRFESVTNRILLQLQDEIEMLGDDLASLDGAIAAAKSPSPRSRPSRHSEPTPMQVELHWQRVELCAVMSSKLDAYHRGLASYHTVSKMPCSSLDEVSELQSLLSAHSTQVSPPSIPYLTHLSDLVTIKHSTLLFSAPHTLDTHTLTQRSTALSTGGAVLMTIIAFKVVPRLPARMVLGAVVVAAMIGCGMLPDLEWDEGKWRRQLGTYVLGVGVLALAVG